MKLRYQQATISFCVDLTAAAGASFPVANLLVGEAEGHRVAGVALRVPSDLDPISLAVLGDTHQLIKKYVDEAFSATAASEPLSAILRRVYHSLRNTMHVSTIAEPCEVGVDSRTRLSSTVIEILQQGLSAAQQRAEPTPAELTEPVRIVDAQTSTDLLPEIPQSFIWAPPSRAMTMATLA